MVFGEDGHTLVHRLGCSKIGCSPCKPYKPGLINRGQVKCGIFKAVLQSLTLIKGFSWIRGSVEMTLKYITLCFESRLIQLNAMLTGQGLEPS